MDELLKAINARGVRVVACRLPEPLRGCYIPADASVYLDIRLTPNEKRVTLAHEAGHVHHGHACDGREVTPRHERQATMYAARALISAVEYAAVERVNPDRHALADELGVTVELIDFYRANCLTALGEVVYAHPKMGAGQWADRIHLPETA